jgi:hypothetical protein
LFNVENQLILQNYVLLSKESLHLEDLNYLKQDKDEVADEADHPQGPSVIANIKLEETNNAEDDLEAGEDKCEVGHVIQGFHKEVMGVKGSRGGNCSEHLAVDYANEVDSEEEAQDCYG